MNAVERRHELVRSGRRDACPFAAVSCTAAVR